MSEIISKYAPCCVVCEVQKSDPIENADCKAKTEVAKNGLAKWQDGHSSNHTLSFPQLLYWNNNTDLSEQQSTHVSSLGPNPCFLQPHSSCVNWQSKIKDFPW